jgi:hypothetical protein
MNFGEWWRRNKAENLPLYHCSLSDCATRTKHPYDADPRKRWMIQIKLIEEDGSELIVNLCPRCIRKYFPKVDDKFFETMENSEALIRKGNMNAEIN